MAAKLMPLFLLI